MDGQAHGGSQTHLTAAGVRRRQPGRGLRTALLALVLVPVATFAASLGTWQTINVGKPAKLFVSGIAHGNGTWVAVGQGGFIATSPDGQKWTKRSAGISRDFNDVIFSGGRFIAVCKAPDAGTGAKIWISDDNGAKWKFRNTDADLDSISVGLHAVATDGSGNLVAVGGIGWVTRSFDNGTTWHVLMPPGRFTVGSLYGVGYGNGQWIATTAGSIYRSSDGGATWTAASTTMGSTHVAFGNNRFLLADNSGGRLLWSADGATWNLATAAVGGSTSFPYAKGCVFADGLFVAVTEYGNLWTSENGRQFKQWRAAGGDPDAWCVAAGNGLFIAAGGDFTLKYGTAWISPPWLRARTGSTWDYPYTAFDTEDGLPRRIGLPEYRINTASLNLVLEATLFYLRTLGSPVNMRLAYNSAPTADGADTIGLFGKNWRFRYESVIGAFGTEAKVITGGGRTYLYTTPTGQDLATASPGSPITLRPPEGVFDELRFYGPGQYFEFREKASRVTCRYAVAGGPGNAVWRLTRITDRSGNQITLDVDGASGRIATITDPAGRVVTLSYDTVANLCTRISAPDGRRLAFIFDAHKNLTGITDMADYTASYSYDSLGFLTQMTTAGRQNRFTYGDRPGFETGTGDPEKAGDKVVASVTNAEGRVTTYELLPNNTGMKRTDAKGGVTVFTSNAGQTARVADPLGNVSRMEYSQARLPATLTDAAGKTTTFVHDARGNLLATADALGYQTTMTYDGRDNLATRTNALGKTWRYTYDGNDRVTAVQTPLLNATQFTYFSNGRLRTLRDARTNSTSFEYDVYGNLTRVTDPLTHSVQLAYDPLGLHCTSLTDARGKTKTLQYDRNDRLTTVRYDSVAGAPQRVNAFDAFGQTSLTDELGQVTAVTRDEFGYLTSITDPLGNATHSAYDSNHNPVSFTDALGRISTTTYDAANRPLVLTDALGKTVKREYDAEGNLVSLTDTRNSKTTFTYDPNNRLLETKDPLLKTVGLGRDALGRAATTTNARGQAVRHTYDDDGRLVKKEYRETVGGSFVQKAAFTYDPNGNVLSRLDDWGTTTYTYDPRNQPTAVTYPTGKAAAFTYTAAGHLASVTYPTGLVVSYTYDDYNRLALPAQFRNAAGAELLGNHERPGNVTQLGMALGGATKTLSFAYDRAGNRLSETRPNLTSTTYVYDTAQRVTRVLHRGADASALLQYDLVYNGVSSVTRETITGSARLTAGLPDPDTITYNAGNQVTKRNGKAYTYDADGNLTAIADGEFAATYTAENRPSQIIRSRDGMSETIQYTYDAGGLRVRRAVVGGVTTQFHYGPDDRLLFTTTATGEVTASYVWSGKTLVAVLSGSALDTDLRYVHLNRLGHVMALTAADGTPTTTYAYQPNGLATRESVPSAAADSELFTFVGGLGVQDEGGGLFYMKNRFYDANCGRFLQKDPLGFAGGLNLYAYAENTPTNAVDPAGLVRDEAFLCAPEDRFKGLYNPTAGSAAAAVFHKTVKEYLLKTPGKVVYDAARGKSAAEIAVSLLVKSPVKNLVMYGLGVTSGGWSIAIGLGIDAAEPAVASALADAAETVADSVDDAVEAIDEAPGVAKEAFWNYTETGSVLGDPTNPDAVLGDGF
jgi:RHS repeat-associated protein